MLQVQCPKCKHRMLYNPVKTVKNKTKRCVYCGKYFTVYGEKTNQIIKIIRKTL